VLTTVELDKMEKGSLKLPETELHRIESILKKALDVEKGIVPRPQVTEAHPDGLDLSLYKDESQLEKKTPRKRKSVLSPLRSSKRGGKKSRKSLISPQKLSKDKNFSGKENAQAVVTVAPVAASTATKINYADTKKEVKKIEAPIVTNEKIVDSKKKQIANAAAAAAAVAAAASEVAKKTQAQQNIKMAKQTLNKKITASFTPKANNKLIEFFLYCNYN